jgi:hypothetical protein
MDDIPKTQIEVNKMTKEEKYAIKEAKTTEEAIELLKQGYEYVTTTPNGTMLFRKPK